jgi:hypothetical protein
MHSFVIKSVKVNSRYTFMDTQIPVAFLMDLVHPVDFHGQRSSKTKFSVSFARMVNSVLRIVYPLNLKNTAVCPILYAVHAITKGELRL